MGQCWVAYGPCGHIIGVTSVEGQEARVVKKDVKDWKIRGYNVLLLDSGVTGTEPWCSDECPTLNPVAGAKALTRVTAERDAALARANAAEARVKELEDMRRGLEDTIMGMGAESSTRADVIRGLRARVNDLEAQVRQCAVEKENLGYNVITALEGKPCGWLTQSNSDVATTIKRVLAKIDLVVDDAIKSRNALIGADRALDAHKRALDEALFSGDARRAAEDSDTHVWRNHIRAIAGGSRG